MEYLAYLAIALVVVYLGYKIFKPGTTIKTYPTQRSSDVHDSSNVEDLN